MPPLAETKAQIRGVEVNSIVSTLTDKFSRIANEHGSLYEQGASYDLMVVEPLFSDKPPTSAIEAGVKFCWSLSFIPGEGASIRLRSPLGDQYDLLSTTACKSTGYDIYSVIGKRRAKPIVDPMQREEVVKGLESFYKVPIEIKFAKKTDGRFQFTPPYAVDTTLEDLLGARIFPTSLEAYARAIRSLAAEFADVAYYRDNLDREFGLHVGQRSDMLAVVLRRPFYRYDEGKGMPRIHLNVSEGPQLVFERKSAEEVRLAAVDWPLPHQAEAKIIFPINQRPLRIAVTHPQHEGYAAVMVNNSPDLEGLEVVTHAYDGEYLIKGGRVSRRASQASRDEDYVDVTDDSNNPIHVASAENGDMKITLQNDRFELFPGVRGIEVTVPGGTLSVESLLGTALFEPEKLKMFTGIVKLIDKPPKRIVVYDSTKDTDSPKS